MRRWLLRGAIGAVVLAVAWAAFNRGHCAYTGWQLERDTRYAPMVGCLVKNQGGWLPVQALREVE